VTRDTLAAGAVRYRATSGDFVYQRLDPGILGMAMRGRDSDEFGAAPLDAIEREYRLFGRPAIVFFDGFQAESPASAVSDRWVAWLRTNRDVLQKMHVLAGRDATHLRIEIARHFSDSHNRLKLYTDRAEWVKALALTAPETDPARISAHFDELPVSITTERGRDSVKLSSPGSTWQFQLLQSSVLFSRFTGDDRGDLTDAALDEMDRFLSTSTGRITWLLDLKDARTVVASVSRAWTEWLTHRNSRFARISAFATSPLFPLVLTVAKYRSGIEHVLTIHREPEPFRQELRTLVSEDALTGLGV
jgi:hypothetical protein